MKAIDRKSVFLVELSEDQIKALEIILGGSSDNDMREIMKIYHYPDGGNANNELTETEIDHYCKCLDEIYDGIESIYNDYGTF